MKYPYRYKEYGVVPPPGPFMQVVIAIVGGIIMFAILSVLCTGLFGSGNEVLIVTPF